MTQSNNLNLEENKEVFRSIPEVSEFPQAHDLILFKCMKCGFYVEHCQCNSEIKRPKWFIFKAKIRRLFFNHHQSRIQLRDYYYQKYRQSYKAFEKYSKMFIKIDNEIEGIKIPKVRW